jgi:hypothetical protein
MERLLFFDRRMFFLTSSSEGMKNRRVLQTFPRCVVSSYYFAVGALTFDGGDFTRSGISRDFALFAVEHRHFFRNDVQSYHFMSL